MRIIYSVVAIKNLIYTSEKNNSRCNWTRSHVILNWKSTNLVNWINLYIRRMKKIMARKNSLLKVHARYKNERKIQTNYVKSLDNINNNDIGYFFWNISFKLAKKLAFWRDLLLELL